MTGNSLKVLDEPKLTGARMILGFSGWMDGGEVSTGGVEHLVRALQARPLAEIEGDEYNLLSFPGSMELASLFRPHVKIVDGVITEYNAPSGTFYYSEPTGLIVFGGREPNFRWGAYADDIFRVVDRFDVDMMIFIGSVAGLTPHTREPRLFSSVSDESVKDVLRPYRIRFTDYEGPASFITYLMRQAQLREVPLATLVAEIPAYVQGRNPRCIEAVLRQLAGMLNVQINLDELRDLAGQLEEQLGEIVEEKPELKERIEKLEHDYDNDVFETEMGDLKDWLKQQGINPS